MSDVSAFPIIKKRIQWRVKKDKRRNKCPNYPRVGSIPAMDLRNYDNAETEGGVAEN